MDFVKVLVHHCLHQADYPPDGDMRNPSDVIHSEFWSYMSLEFPVCVCVCVCVCVYAVSRVQFFVIPLNVACQSPLSREFSRQEYWSGLPFPSPGNFPDPGVGIRGRTQVSCIAGRYFAIGATREALNSP